MCMRKTKIICTLGPAADSDEVVRDLMLAGMNVARLNFSHGSYEEHQQRIDRVKRIREELDLPVALLLDTKGPEIRTGEFEGGKTNFIEGSEVVIREKDVIGTDKEFSVSYKDLAGDVKEGSRILIDDGLIELIVDHIDGGDIYCTVSNGGPVSTKKSVNVPDAELCLPALTAKDKEDILFAVKNEFDFIAASFVRKAKDVQEIRHILEKNGDHGINIIAKIENNEGIQNFDEILKVSNGIMVARGDLGVEIPAANVPIVQKRCIQQCHSAGKISITATQMLDSMIRNPRPTRAEVSDVANAIYDGTSAVMLSGETANGKYPVEALKMMVQIAEQTEESIDYWYQFSKSKPTMMPSVANAISHATCTTAMDLNAKAIVTVTHGGRTARQISRFRSLATVNLQALGKSIVHGNGQPTSDEQSSLVTGTVYIVKDPEHLDEQLPLSEDDSIILVAPYTNNKMMPFIKHAKALIVEDDDSASHAATVAMALDIPAILSCENCTKLLKEGATVSVDAKRGSVS